MVTPRIFSTFSRDMCSTVYTSSTYELTTKGREMSIPPTILVGYSTLYL